MKILTVLSVIILFAPNLLPQNDYIPSEHPVYEFLNLLSAKGILESYNDEVLPLTRREIVVFLNAADSLKKNLSNTESELILKYLQRFDLNYDIISIADGNWGSLISNKEKRFYFYKDSLASFVVNPVADMSFVYSGKDKKSAYLLNFGGRAYGSYGDWLGFNVQATNGIVKGDREAALQDVRVKNSFTFNQTRINYFDETTGHIALHKGILDLQFGRERLLWGNGSGMRIGLSENSPVFDMLRLKLEYKSLSYQFIHGWLVQPAREEFVDSVTGNVKIKQPKYIAANRLGINFPGAANFGLSQVIIYSNRPVEAAYLNPFLLWESAQRSLGDLDNSFLIFDAKIKSIKGVIFSGSFLFDDINFNWFDDWNNVSNRSVWQLSSLISYPYMPKNVLLRMDYSQVRPYTFSHIGVNEALTYTNNGYMLGYPYQPNSSLFRIALDYYPFAEMKIRTLYEYYIHGRNSVDDENNLIRNYGGDVMVFYRYADPEKAYLLDGEIEKQNTFIMSLEYEFLRNYSLAVAGTYSDLSFAGNKDSELSLSAAIRIFYE